MYPPKYLKRISENHGINFHIIDQLMFSKSCYLDNIMSGFKPSMCLTSEFLISHTVELTNQAKLALL